MRLALLFVLVAGGGCSGNETVITPVPERPLQPVAAQLLAQPVDVAVGVDGGRLLVSSDEGLRLLRTSEDPGIIVADPGSVGRIRDVFVGRDNVLVAGDGGLFILHESNFFGSPLQGSLAEGERVRSFEASSGVDGEESFWMMTTAGLYRIEGPNLRSVSLPDITGWDSALMGRAPGIRGSVVWVAVDGRLFELGISRGSVFVGEVQLSLEVTSMATDGEGDLWFVAESSLYRLTQSRDLERFVLPVVPESVLATTEGPDLWVLGEGALWHLANDRLRFVEVMIGEATAVAQGTGNLLIAGSSGLTRYSARRNVSVLGVTDGSRITGTTEVLITPEAGDLSTVRALLDGEPLRMMEEPWRVELEPARLSTGSHSLRFEAEYMDGTLPAFLAYTIVVGQSVTWTQDVLPIMQEHCARCHGTEESASTRLDTQQAWIDNADSIIYNLREGRMPLDDEALAASDVDLVSAWKASGFPE